MDFLGYLSRRARGRNIQILASCRPDAEVPERVRAVLLNISQEGLLHQVDVRMLTEKESGDFLTALSHGKGPLPSTVHEWYSLSHGNPLALEQLLRGDITTVEATKQGPARTSSMLTKLNDDERRVLTHAAVLGKAFRFPVIYRALGGDEEKLTEMIDSLIRKRTLKERGEETYEFTSDELWRDVYDTMTESRRRILHRKVAQALEGDRSGEGLNTYDLAKHYFLALDYEKGLTYNRQAADLARKSMDYEAAALYLDQALHCLRNTPTRDRKDEEALTLELALCLDVTGSLDKAINLLEGMLSPGLLTLHLATLYGNAGRWKEAGKLAKGTLEYLGAAGDPALLGMANQLLGGVASYGGDNKEAAIYLEKAVGYLQKAKMLPQAARAKLLLADKKRNLPNVDRSEIEATYKDGIAELKSTGNATLLATALNNFGLWYMEQNRLDDGIHALEEALSFAENSHNARVTGWTLFNLADVLLMHNEDKRAEELNARAKDCLEKVGDKMGLIQVHLVSARVHELRGENGAAEVELNDALRFAEDVGFELDKLEVLFRQGEFFLRIGDRQGARKMLQELELKEFTKLRPDLAKDFDRFRTAVLR
jgi:tetratricopeptide (TPR) repeat protein